MNTEEELEIVFRQAVESINQHKEPFPADFLLRLYAFYKRATGDLDAPGSNKPLINAFKTNALFQIKDVSRKEAKQLYVDAVNHYFLYRK